MGVIWPTFSAPKLELTSAGATFKRLYTKRYKHAPLIYQAFTWDQLNAWKWAVDTVGSIAPADVVPALPRIDMQGTMGRITLSNQPKTRAFQPVGRRQGLLRPGAQAGRHRRLGQGAVRSTKGDTSRL